MLHSRTLVKRQTRVQKTTQQLILLKKLFNIETTTITQAKKDRIDSQYYLPYQQQKPINEQLAKQSLKEVQNYYDIIRTCITTNAKKEETRKKFQNIFL